uniref:NUC194 domain-containing protein n=1 Tax=Macrostomum lignano TaxID=282301 RepID=A0A1I8FHT3_9PLAT
PKLPVAMLTILAASPLLKAATAPATAAATIARLPALAAILESLAASHSQAAGQPDPGQVDLVQQLWDYGNDDCRFSVLGILTNLLAVDAEVNGLALLGYMCRNPSTERAERLSSQLKLLCSETVLMRCSNQLGINSHAYCQYVRAFRGLLLAQETSEHPLLLEILSILVCKERQHALEAEFQQCLNRLLPARIPIQRCRDFVTWPWRLFRGDSAAVASLCHGSVLLDFVATDDCLEYCLTCLLNAQQSLAGFNESETEEILLLARGCCRVLSCFYMACGLTELALPRLCDAFKRFYSRQPAAQKDPDRSLRATGSPSNATTWSLRVFPAAVSRPVRCSVKRTTCLVHCIKAASDKERSYLPPFTENAAKRKFIFDNIVPTDVDYQLPLQVEQYSNCNEPCAKRQPQAVPGIVRPSCFISVRFLSLEAGPTDDLSWLNPSSSSTSAVAAGTNSLQFAASQFLADSSLSSDVSQFDRSFAINQRRSRKNRFHNQTLTATRRNLIVLESDSVNDHPCMATMKHAAEGVECSTDSHPNVRIFLMKLLINCQDIFQPYAHFWLRPMCQFALSDRNGGQGFHTLLVDIVYFFVAWTTLGDRDLVERLLDKLTGLCYDKERRIFKNNWRLLDALIRSWRSRVHCVPYKRIFDLLQQDGGVHSGPRPAFSCTTPTCRTRCLISMNSRAGVNVGGVDSPQILAALVRLLNHSRKEVYSPCAGRDRPVSQADGHGSECCCAGLLQAGREQLGKMLTARPDAGLHALAQVSRCCPRLACIEFRQRLLFQLPHLTGDSLADCLRPPQPPPLSIPTIVGAERCCRIERARLFFDSLKRLFALSSARSASVSAESRVPQNSLALCERLLLLLQQQERLADAEQAAIKQQRVWLLAAVGEMCLASTGAGAGSVAALTLPQGPSPGLPDPGHLVPNHPNLCAPAFWRGLTDSAESNRAWSYWSSWSRNSGLPPKRRLVGSPCCRVVMATITADEDSNRRRRILGVNRAVLPAFLLSCTAGRLLVNPGFPPAMFDRPLADCPFRECRIDARRSGDGDHGAAS